MSISRLWQSKHSVLSLALSTLLSACVFVTSASFATTMTVTDTQIALRLKHAIAQDKTLAGLKITPIVNMGQVQLKGTVHYTSQAIEVIELAEHMQGVKSVDSKELILKANNRPITSGDDIYISAKIKRLFEKNKVFGDKSLDKLGISVDTTDGVVKLGGEIKESIAQVSIDEYKDQMKNAIKLAKEIKGVKSVDPHKLVLIVEYTE